MIHQLAGVIGSSQVIAAAAGHEYCRLNITQNGGWSSTGICEIELRGSVGGADLTGAHTSATHANGTASASYEHATLAPWKAVDNLPGKANGRWYLNVQTGWWKYQFTTSADIVQYTVQAYEPDGFSFYYPKAWTLQWSDDNSSWTTAHTVTNQVSWGIDQTRTYTV